MKVFLSWSGERSKKVAKALFDHLEIAVNEAVPWVSFDIPSGTRWLDAINAELGTSKHGIVCVTPENLNSRWILFEAGALANAVSGSKVHILLVGVKKEDLEWPLGQFQATTADEAGVKKMILEINADAERVSKPSTLEHHFDSFWKLVEPIIQEAANAALPPQKVDARNDEAKLDELVSQVKQLTRSVASLSEVIARNSVAAPEGELTPLMRAAAQRTYEDVMNGVTTGSGKSIFQVTRDWLAANPDNVGKAIQRPVNRLEQLVQDAHVAHLEKDKDKKS